MKKLRPHQLFAACLTAIVLLLCISCEKKLEPATIIVTDPVRHYYPVVQGEMLGITYEMENTCEHPLFIQEVQTTCGCIIPRDALPIVILPHKSGFLHLDFNTIKNSGYVSHHIYCYGNFRDSARIHLSFDTNVVPQADYIRDYEQLWQEQIRHRRSVRSFVDGESSQKGYYTNEHEDPRTLNKEEIQNTVDTYTP
ncbi:MAG: DUF1573 domain-containing protein [Bacteroidaceae bacterium]|nr:DUF1573 domain-containing protein [Bacteroidaceae bacterium]